MKSALVIQHVAFEGLGTLEAVLVRCGYHISVVEAAFLTERQGDVSLHDLVIVLGGPIGVYDSSVYPFLSEEMRMIEGHLGRGGAFLGICLGSQLLAHVLGARVYFGGKKEIGWSHLSLTEAGKRSPLNILEKGSVQVLHWHGDTFDLPEGSTLLASSSLYPNQAFEYGPRVLGLQFHCEVTAHDLERWYVGHASELSGVEGLSVNSLRESGRRYAPLLEEVSRRIFSDWLGQLEKVS
ncbi:MAG: glutamine amidotransferase [Leptospirales bacterium]